MASPSQPLVWIDCEMTGLDPDHDEILEIYCLITDGQLSLVRRAGEDGQEGEEDPGWGAVVHMPAERLAQMDEWCTTHHEASGLTDAVLASTVTAEQAAEGLLAYIQKHIPQPRAGLLAGNSVHADKAFLRRAPYDRVLAHLHYRILDVSSFKEAARRWGKTVPGPNGPAPTAPPPPKKQGAHRARADILESIAEARHYKAVYFEGS